MYLTEENKPKYYKPVIVTYYLALVCVGIGTTVWGPIMSSLAEGTGSSISTLSMVFVFVGIGSIISTVALSRLYDRINGHVLMSISLLVLAASIFAIRYASSAGMVLAIALVLGAALTMVDLGGNTLLPWLMHDSPNLKPTFNSMHLSSSIGFIIAPTVVGLFTQAGNTYREAVILLAALLVPVAILLLCLPAPRQLSGSKKTASGESVYNEAAQTRIAILFGVVFFMTVGAQRSFDSWISTIAATALDLDTASAAYFSTYFAVGIFVGRILVSIVSKKVSPRRICNAALAFCIATMLLILFTAHSAIMLAICTFLSGIFISPLFANVLLTIDEKFVSTGKTNGIVFTFNKMGSIILSWIFGQVISGEHSVAIFSGVLAIVFAAAAVVFIAVNKKYPSPEEMEA